MKRKTVAAFILGATLLTAACSTEQPTGSSETGNVAESGETADVQNSVQDTVALTSRDMMITDKKISIPCTIEEFLTQIGADNDVATQILSDEFDGYVPANSKGNISFTPLTSDRWHITLKIYNDSAENIDVKQGKIYGVYISDLSASAPIKFAGGVELDTEFDEESIRNTFPNKEEYDDSAFYNDGAMEIYLEVDEDNTISGINLRDMGITNNEALIDVGNVLDLPPLEDYSNDMAAVSWETGQIKINDTQITFPCDLQEIIDASNGTLQVSPITLEQGRTLASGTCTYIDITNSEGQAFCRVRVENTTDQTIDALSSKVYGIDVSSTMEIFDGAEFDITYPHGFKIGQLYTIEDLEGILGTNWEEYNGGYMWQIDNADGTYSQINLNLDRTNKIINMGMGINSTDLFFQ